MESVSSALGIDKINMDGKFILIEERHNTNANCILHSVILNGLRKHYNICFILFHSTFDHYHKVCMKFGCNLKAHKEKGKIAVVEPMKTIETENFPKLMFGSNCTLIENILTIIKNEYQELTKLNEPVIIAVDDLSHLSNLGFNLNESLYFVRYLRSVMECNNKSQLCILMHVYAEEMQKCDSDFLVNFLKFMAHLDIMVDPLNTGYSNDASGKITINWRIDSIREKYNLSEVAKYLFKLCDREVKVFVPGTDFLA